MNSLGKKHYLKRNYTINPKKNNLDRSPETTNLDNTEERTKSYMERTHNKDDELSDEDHLSEPEVASNGPENHDKTGPPGVPTRAGGKLTVHIHGEVSSFHRPAMYPEKVFVDT